MNRAGLFYSSASLVAVTLVAAWVILQVQAPASASQPANLAHMPVLLQQVQEVGPVTAAAQEENLPKAEAAAGAAQLAPAPRQAGNARGSNLKEVSPIPARVGMIPDRRFKSVKLFDDIPVQEPESNKEATFAKDDLFPGAPGRVDLIPSFGNWKKDDQPSVSPF